jgi:hypothetical protein
MSETPPPEERKQARDANIIDRRNESQYTVDGITAPLDAIDETALNAIDDADARAAMRELVVGYAHLAECVTGSDPPAHEPFGAWHRSIAVGQPTVETVTATDITVAAAVTEYKFFDKPATVTLRVTRPDSLNTDPITATTTASATGEVTLTVTGLDPSTEYRVSVSVECGDMADYSQSVKVTTKEGGK